MVEAPKLSSKALVYKQARDRVLKDYPEWRRNEVLKMEADHDTDNRYYNDFVKNVIALAEDS
jgi:hypothetical protein